MSYTDDHTRYSAIFLVCQKSKTLKTYQQYEAWLSTQHSAKIKELHTDKGGKYSSDKFKAHLAAQGTKHTTTVHNTPEHNGNRTFLKKVRAMLHTSGLPKNLWGEALKHTVWLKNRTSTRALNGKTLYKMLHG